MKYLFLISIVLSIAMTSCIKEPCEVPPEINFQNITEVDTTYVSAAPDPQLKHVLIEESTGVQCVNCPKATQILHDMDAQYNNRIDLISIHYGGGVLNEPHDDTEPDLRPEASVGSSYISLLGGLVGQPAAAIDRLLDPSSGYIMNGRSIWSSQVADQMAKSTPVNISLESKIDEGNNALVIDFKLHYNKDMSADEPHFYSIVLLENDIEGTQDSSGVKIKNYKFKDVFRTFIGSGTGTQIDASREAGRVIEKKLYISLDELHPSWNTANLAMVLFVHKNTANNKEVLHSSEVHVE